MPDRQPFSSSSESRAASVLKVVGEDLTVLVDKNAARGYEVFLQDGPAGSGPPPHHHDWDESFFVFEGQIEFGFGGKTMLGTPGAFVHIPAGTEHWFRFMPGGGKMVSITSEGNASKFFTEVDRDVSATAPDLETLVAVAARHALTVNAG